jgi:signal transduction histidine kinase
MPLSDSAGGAPPAGNGGNVEPDWRGMFIDREGSAWRLGQTGKLVRMPLTAARGAAGRRAARAARESLSFSPVVGMSGSAATAGLEDREGTVWLGTQGGLDQFRATKLTPVVLPRGMTDPVIVAGDTGAAWAWGHPGPLVAIGDGVVEHSEVSGRITAMSRDLEGGVWVGGFDGLWYKGPRTHAGTFTPVTLPPEGSGSLIQAIARDRDGTLWLSVLFRGVFRRRAHVWEHYVPRQDFRRDAYAGAIHADHAGRTWLGYKGDRLALVTAKGARVFSAADGLRVGPVTAIHARGARVWVGGETGVVYLDDVRDGARFVPLAVANGALHSVSGIVETADGDLWLNSDEGVTRVPAAELRHAQRDPGYRARADRFGIRDGLEGAAVHIRPLGTAVEGTDGRLWFTTQTSIAWLDPRQIRRNLLPPPVQIRTLEADGTQYTTSDRVTLPRRTTALSVAYTALSLAVPERVRFRYRLVGVDTAWQDAGARREAFYTNLRPGAYRFQVIAANDDGVWNTTGAALEFVIPPTFVQTNAFFLLCIAGSATTLWLLVQWRQRRATAAMRARFDATFAERLRVARELHDTLLSGVAGLAMRLDAVAMRARSSSSVDVAALDQLREQARLTLTEAREAVVGMRASGDALVPLSARLANAARRVFAETDVDVRLVVTGPQRRHGQALEEEVLRIAMEAMTNARDHAHGRTVTVTCAYGERELCVRVRDDGRGFDPARAMANGHFGMAGMRERAASIGARLTVTSAPGRGTDVLLVVGPLQRVMSADAAW